MYRYFSLSNALTKRKGNLSHFWEKERVKKPAIAIVERAITKKIEIKKRSKDLIPKTKQRRLRVITLWGTIEKNAKFAIAVSEK